MLISIIIPIYNAETYLERCLESVLGQTYLNMEIILVDDGSTDSSGEICDSYGSKDTRIIVIHQHNGGVASARNAGLAVASGEYIVFVDSDDALPLNTVEIYVNTAREHGADIISGSYKRCSNNNLQLAYSECGSLKSTIQTVEEFCLDSKNRTYVWGKAYRRDLAVGYRFPTNYYAEDIYYNGLIFSDSSITSICVLDCVVYYHISNPQSITHTWSTEQLINSYECLQNLYEVLRARLSSREQLLSIYLVMLLSHYCQLKYNLILRQGFSKDIKYRYKRIINRYIRDLLRNNRVSWIKKVGLLVFLSNNQIFRMWLLWKDPTMRKYEKQVLARE